MINIQNLGMFNTSELVLHWETQSPTTLAPELHLTEYALLNTWTNETTINADLNDLRHGAFGKYDRLSQKWLSLMNILTIS